MAFAGNEIGSRSRAQKKERVSSALPFTPYLFADCSETQEVHLLCHEYHRWQSNQILRRFSNKSSNRVRLISMSRANQLILQHQRQHFYRCANRPGSYPRADVIVASFFSLSIILAENSLILATTRHFVGNPPQPYYMQVALSGSAFSLPCTASMSLRLFGN